VKQLRGLQPRTALANRFSMHENTFLYVFDNGDLKESTPWGALQKHELMLKMAHYL